MEWITILNLYSPKSAKYFLMAVFYLNHYKVFSYWPFYKIG